jgi:hypothetical protein
MSPGWACSLSVGAYLHHFDLESVLRRIPKRAWPSDLQRRAHALRRVRGWLR